MAAYEGHLQIVDLLIKHGADIDCKDLLGMTPLHWAVQNGHADVVEYLVSNGAEATEPNKFGLTPQAIAQQTERLDIESLLDLATAVEGNASAQNLLIQLATGQGVEEVQGADENMELEEDDRKPIIIPIEPGMLEQLQSSSAAIDETEDTDTGQMYDQVNLIDSESDSEHFLKDDRTPSQSFQEQEEQQEQYRQTEDHHQVNGSFEEDHGQLTVPLSLLQDGILLQNESEETNILNTAMDNGHSVVLTEAGKEVLNSFRQSEQQQSPLHMEKKIVSLTPEEFLAMTNGTMSKNLIRVKTIPAKGQFKRIVMKKTKAGSPINISNGFKKIVSKQRTSSSEIDNIMNQLIQARKTIEEYKVKLKKKEEEAEHYKMQLQLLMDPNS
nr:unnamed protein product [Callosobruchus chinensis]